MRRVKEAVPIYEAVKRALFLLAAQPSGSFTKASAIAYAVWPMVTFNAQGAGGAGSRILRRAEKLGMVLWRSGQNDWGWQITPVGRAWLRNPIPTATMRYGQIAGQIDG